MLLHREAQRLSVTDPLTGAGNLRHMTTTLAREVERATRFERPLALLLLDLDHFKRVNDTFGHTVGDAVLRELARRLHEAVREVDTVARYGGEEFVIICPETDAEGAGRLADRVCQTVRDDDFLVGEDVVPVTVSVGVASLPQNGVASGDLVRSADEALYAAKHAGRDQWRSASDLPPPEPLQRAATPDGPPDSLRRMSDGAVRDQGGDPGRRHGHALPARQQGGPQGAAADRRHPGDRVRRGRGRRRRARTS